MSAVVTLRIGTIIETRWRTDEIFRRRLLLREGQHLPPGGIVQVVGRGGLLEHYRRVGKSGLRKVSG